MKRILSILCVMAYLNLNCEVTIGQVVFKNINQFEITESVSDLSDKATITLPKNYKELNGKPATDFMKPGDEVIIKMGYNGNLFQEYRGFVSEVGADIPLQISCDELYNLRQGNIEKSYNNVTLEHLLRTHITGYKIECPGVNLGKVLLDNCTPYQMLDDLIKDFGFYSKVFNNEILHVGWAYDWQPKYTKRHQYIFASNIKSTKNLKYKHREDFNTRVKVTIYMPDGSKEVVIVGSKNDKAAVNSISVANKTKAQAKEIGEARYKKAVFDGFEGKVIGYGIPRVHAGDSVEFISKKHPDRNGAYLVESVTTRYQEDGIDRECKIGFKV